MHDLFFTISQHEYYSLTNIDEFLLSACNSIKCLINSVNVKARHDLKLCWKC